MAEKEKNKTSLNSTELKKYGLKTISPIIKHRAIIAFIVGGSFLAFSLFTVQNILLNASDLADEGSLKTISTNFNDETIEKVNDLKARSESTDLSLPKGDINPFK